MFELALACLVWAALIIWRERRAREVQHPLASSMTRLLGKRLSSARPLQRACAGFEFGPFFWEQLRHAVPGKGSAAANPYGAYKPPPVFLPIQSRGEQDGNGRASTAATGMEAVRQTWDQFVESASC